MRSLAQACQTDRNTEIHDATPKKNGHQNVRPGQGEGMEEGEFSEASEQFSGSLLRSSELKRREGSDPLNLSQAREDLAALEKDYEEADELWNPCTDSM